jgi:hypothetical protein
VAPPSARRRAADAGLAGQLAEPKGGGTVASAPGPRGSPMQRILVVEDEMQIAARFATTPGRGLRGDGRWRWGAALASARGERPRPVVLTWPAGTIDGLDVA